MTQDQQQRDPQDCPDVDLVWLDLTEANARACVDATAERARRWKANPDHPIGMPGDLVTVAVIDLPQHVTPLCVVMYAILRVALCVHGELPPMVIDGTAGRGRTWMYCCECAVYMPEEDIPTHRPSEFIRNLT